jgi:hypothetical protein
MLEHFGNASSKRLDMTIGSITEPAKSLSTLSIITAMEGEMVVSSGGIAILVLGLSGAIIGAMLYGVYQEEVDDCQYLFHRTFNEEKCENAEFIHGLGFFGMLFGVIFAIIGGILMAIPSVEKPSYHQFTCPRCQATLTYQYSPTNCYNCGLPIDWDKAKAPQK